MPAATAITTTTLPRTPQTEASGAGFRRLATAVVVALAGAGSVHLAVGLDHGTTGHGPLLLAAGAAQLGLAASLAQPLTRPRLWASVVLGVLVTAAWAFTRLGDEPVGLLDGATAATQLGVVAASALLARRTARRAFRPSRRLIALAVGVVIGIAAAQFLASDHGHHDHHGQPATTQPAIFGDLFAPHGHHEPLPAG